MAGLKARAAFRFSGRPSPARTWDIRFRVAATAVVSAGVLYSDAAALVPLAVLVFLLLGLARARAREVVAVLRAFSGFLLFFVGLGLLFEPTGTEAVFLTLQGARLVLLLLLGHFLFLAATPADVTEGVRWYLGWLGRRRAWTAASMASWALASVPLVLDQAALLMDAAVLRGLSLRRHPLKTMKLLTLGLLVRTIGRSSDLAAALEARGFGTAVPPSPLRARTRDAAALAGVGAWVAASWFAAPMLY